MPLSYTTLEWAPEKRANSSYVGRNGLGQAHGLEVAKNHNYVTIQPINSKGNLATCLIQFPTEFTGHVCAMLQVDLLNTVLTALKDQLPRLIGLDPELDKLVQNKLKEV